LSEFIYFIKYCAAQERYWEGKSLQQNCRQNFEMCEEKRHIQQLDVQAGTYWNTPEI